MKCDILEDCYDEERYSNIRLKEKETKKKYCEGRNTTYV